LELNWSTFVLEIINFLILIWILKRFLYKPVLDVIARRQASIQKDVSDAQTLHEKAIAMEEEYNNRLTEWKNERNKLFIALKSEIDAERQKRLKELQIRLEEEQEKSNMIEQHKLETLRLNLQEKAFVQGAQFSSRVLAEAAGPEVEKNLLSFFLKEFSSLPPEQLDKLHDCAAVKTDRILVTSAYPIESDTRSQLEQAITNKLKVNAPFHYEQDQGLLAGVRIAMGAWVLLLNLQDELKSFTELAHET